MVVYSLLIVNRDGGLVYHKDFVTARPVDLRVASSFHVMFAMATKISPVAHSSGILELVAEGFKLQCKQTPTGIKFYFISDPGHSSASLNTSLNNVLDLYVDYVLKNPFQSLEQPIRCEKFDLNVTKALVG